MDFQGVERNENFPLAEESVYFGGMLLIYHLFAHREGRACGYRIRIEKDMESCTEEIGNNLSKALKCYHTVVRGAVTPSALVAVLNNFS